jgi:hypothetical protein
MGQNDRMRRNRNYRPHYRDRPNYQLTFLKASGKDRFVDGLVTVLTIDAIVFCGSIGLYYLIQTILDILGLLHPTWVLILYWILVRPAIYIGIIQLIYVIPLLMQWQRRICYARVVGGSVGATIVAATIFFLPQLLTQG